MWSPTKSKQVRILKISPSESLTAPTTRTGVATQLVARLRSSWLLPTSSSSSRCSKKTPTTPARPRITAHLLSVSTRTRSDIRSGKRATLRRRSEKVDDQLQDPRMDPMLFAGNWRLLQSSLHSVLAPDPTARTANRSNFHEIHHQRVRLFPGDLGTPRYRPEGGTSCCP